MKTNKLGIPIDTDDTMPYIEGHSIVKLKYRYNTSILSIVYYRMFLSRNPYINNLYGIHLNREYNNENK